MILDPWNTSIPFILQNGKNIILGPLKDIKSNIRYNIDFIYEDKGNNIYYLYTSHNESTDLKNLYIKL
jgi:hypothetical protein